MVFDGHSDLLYDVTRRRMLGENRVLERCHRAQLLQGGVEGLVLSLWTSGTPETFWKETDCRTAAQRTARMMACAQAELAECQDWLVVVRTAREAERARAAGRQYAFLGIEGMEAIGADLSGIDRYAGWGARLGMLTWNEENFLATGVWGDSLRGLTALGKRAVHRMRQRGMVVDVSHLNDRRFQDVALGADGVVIASHSNCRRLCSVPRNLTDDQLRFIRDTGGVVGLNVHHAFVHEEAQKQTAEMLARHAAHMADVMGVEHVACGFDFCQYMGPGNEGAEGMENASQIKNLFYWLERMGMHSQELQMIARDNFLRVLA